MYTIGRLARRAKVSADTIRFYERQGLITAASKLDCGYHLYTDEALRLILFIKHVQVCGFSLADVSELLRLGTAVGDAGSSTFAERKQEQIRETIDRLEALSAGLKTVVAAKTGRAGAESAAMGENPLPAAVEHALAQQRAISTSLAGGARNTATGPRLAA